MGRAGIQRRLDALELAQWHQRKVMLDAMTHEEIIAMMDGMVGRECRQWVLDYMDRCDPEEYAQLGKPPDSTNPAQRRFHEALVDYCEKNLWP